jgi:hypothetical protein
VREASEGHLEVVIGRQKIVKMPKVKVGVWYGALPDT